jgi:hypothetical protein
MKLPFNNPSTAEHRRDTSGVISAPSSVLARDLRLI